MASRTDVQEVPQVSSHWAACSSEATCAPRLLPRMRLPDSCGSSLGRDPTIQNMLLLSSRKPRSQHSLRETKTGNHIHKSSKGKGLGAHVKQTLLKLCFQDQKVALSVCFSLFFLGRYFGYFCVILTDSWRSS